MMLERVAIARRRPFAEWTSMFPQVPDSEVLYFRPKEMAQSRHHRSRRFWVLVPEGFDPTKEEVERACATFRTMVPSVRVSAACSWLLGELGAPMSTEGHRKLMARQANCSHEFIVILGRSICRKCCVLHPWDVKELPRVLQ